MSEREMQLPLEGIGGRRFEAEEAVEVLEERVRWRARDAAYLAGRWPALSKRVPVFVIQDFKAMVDGPANPHLRSVVRKPAKNLYDVCQALSWVASHRANAEERLERQEDIPKLIGNLRKHA